MPDLTVVALGGNALILPGQSCALTEQSQNLRKSLAVVVELLRRGEHALITHGNGPQVGHIMLRNESARGRAYDLPLDVCVAQSQGEMGYLIARELTNMLREAGLFRGVVALVTRTLVSDEGPWQPVKPVGPSMSIAEAEAVARQGAVVRGDGHGELKRVVSSPEPRAILEIEAIRLLVNNGAIVVAAGGGGIPVNQSADGYQHGVEAVIDKDLTGSLLATSVGAHRVIDLTNVEHARIAFGTPHARDLQEISVVEAQRYLAEGEFGPGTMQPKMEAALRFVEGGGREFVITTPALAIRALDGLVGTRLVYRS